MERKQIKTVCYGKEDVWQSAEDAKKFFLRAMAGSEGSERERYTNIYIKLDMGMTYCTDDEI